MASSSRATTSEGPRYQGYPYVNLPAFGVPTIDSQTASRYANLPRRPLGTAVRVREESSGTQNNQDNVKTPDSDDDPVLYIDLPGDNESDMYVREDSPNQDGSLPIQTQPRKEVDEHVVYIELPECSGGGVSAVRPEDGPSTNVVQETIFYDQFKNRRIDMMPLTSAAGPYTASLPPERPSTLGLWTPGQGTADSPSSSRPAHPYSPPPDRAYRIPPDDFRLSPLPLTDYPEPPPAYTEIDFRRQESHVIPPTPVPPSRVSPESPQRTRVIVHNQPNMSSSRKVMMCERCRVTVNSLVVRQVTYETHLVALFCFSIAMLPIVPLIYCCDICKSDVHYCPLCNDRIKKEFKLC